MRRTAGRLEMKASTRRRALRRRHRCHLRRLDRLGGTERIIIETLHDLDRRGVNIKSLTEPMIDTTTPMGRALFGMSRTARTGRRSRSRGGRLRLMLWRPASTRGGTSAATRSWCCHPGARPRPSTGRRTCSSSGADARGVWPLRHDPYAGKLDRDGFRQAAEQSYLHGGNRIPRSRVTAPAWGVGKPDNRGPHGRECC